MARALNPAFDATAATPILEARDIALGYPRADGGTDTVLASFALDLLPGETVAVLGPSGVGKSSLLRVLAGLKAADHGSVRVGGATLTGPHPRLGFVFQDACLLPWLNLRDNVGFGLDFCHQPTITRSEKAHRIDAALHEVGLASAAHAYPSELSGGMRQRGALARSLARKPEILLLDEPFSALDEITRGEMQALLRTLTSRHGTAAVLVTHDIDEALYLADRIVLIGGRPARQIDEWRITLPHPRDEAAAELARIRVEIVRGMRQARSGLVSAERLAA